MRVLGLDTSTRTGGAAVLADGRLLAEYLLGVEAAHAERLMPAVERVLADAELSGSDLDGIAVASGPGSFTGIRIGVTTAKALAYVWDKPVVGVNTLEALAWQVAGIPGLVVPALNARRGLVYAAVYSVAVGEKFEPEVICQPRNLLMRDLLLELSVGEQPVAFVGDCRSLFADEIAVALGERWLRLPAVYESLRPSSVASLGDVYLRRGRAMDCVSLLPTYLRKAEAERKWEESHRQ